MSAIGLSTGGSDSWACRACPWLSQDTKMAPEAGCGHKELRILMERHDFLNLVISESPSHLQPFGGFHSHGGFYHSWFYLFHGKYHLHPSKNGGITSSRPQSLKIEPEFPALETWSSERNMEAVAPRFAAQFAAWTSSQMERIDRGDPLLNQWFSIPGRNSVDCTVILGRSERDFQCNHYGYLWVMAVLASHGFPPIYWVFWIRYSWIEQAPN